MLESLIFFASLWVWWLVSSPRRKRRVILPVGIIGSIYLFLTSPVALNLASRGLTFALVPDLGEPTDAIAILGRGGALRSERVAVAAELWQAKRAPKIFVSGRFDAELAIAKLQELGIPNPQVSGESCSRTTEENAQFTAAELHPQGIKKILLLTDFPHMLRAQLLFESFGFHVTTHPLPLPQKWSTTKQLGSIFREYAALIGYRWQDRLRPRTQSEIDRPDADITYRLNTENCRLH